MITVEQATKALEEIVAEYGEDYTYPGASDGTGCAYKDEYGQPSCIVGHVLSRLEPEAFENISALHNISRVNVIRARETFESLAVEDALSCAQEAQDDGETWGYAFKAFKSSLGRKGISVD